MTIVASDSRGRLSDAAARSAEGSGRACVPLPTARVGSLTQAARRLPIDHSTAASPTFQDDTARHRQCFLSPITRNYFIEVLDRYRSRSAGRRRTAYSGPNFVRHACSARIGYTVRLQSHDNGRGNGDPCSGGVMAHKWVSRTLRRQIERDLTDDRAP